MCGRLRRDEQEATIGDRVRITHSDGYTVAQWGNDKNQYAFARIETLKDGGWQGFKTGHVMVDSIQEKGVWSKDERIAIAFIYRGKQAALVTREARPSEVAQFGHRRLPLVVTEQEDGTWRPDTTYRFEANVRQIQMALEQALDAVGGDA